MGNNNSSSSTTDTQELSAYDMKIYEGRREKIFYGSIAVVIFYAVIALLLLLSSYYFESIRFILFNRFLVFTVVFIVGTIIIALILAHQVYFFKAVKVNKRYQYDNLSCPDYWNLKQVYDETTLPVYQKAFSSNIDINLFKYSCEMNSNIFSSNDIFVANFKNGHTGGASPVTDHHFIYTTATGNTSGLPIANLKSVASGTRVLEPDTNKFIFANINDSKSDEIIQKLIDARNTTEDKFQAFKSSVLGASYIMNNYRYDRENNADLLSGGYYYNLLNGDNITPQDNDILRRNMIDNSAFSYNILVKDGAHPDSGTTYKDKNDSTDAGKPIRKPALLDNNLTRNSVAVNTTPLVCNRLYPSLLATVDKDIYENSGGRYDSNLMRCAYSKLCQVPWSEMNCDKYPD